MNVFLVLDKDQGLRPVVNMQMSLAEALQKYGRLIILGDVGAGKTTLLLFLRQLWANGFSKSAKFHGLSFDPCIYIEVSRLGNRIIGKQYKNGYESIIELIRECLASSKSAHFSQLSHNIIEYFLSNYQILFLFDGLNEVKLEYRQECLNVIDELAFKYPKNCYVITTHPHGFEPHKIPFDQADRFSKNCYFITRGTYGFNDPQGWNIYKLRELDNQQIEKFLNLHTNEENADSIFKIFLDAGNPFYRIPLFLYCIMKIFHDTPEECLKLLVSRPLIIRNYIEYLLESKKQPSVKGIQLSQLYAIFKPSKIIKDRVTGSQ